jgi:uncharacterized membrane protein
MTESTGWSWPAALDDTRRRWAGVVVLWVAISWWAAVVGRLVVQRHDRFATVDFDLGIHDQSLWLLAHGHWFNTVVGAPVLGHHAVFMYFLMAPLVWLGGGPNLWNLLQVAALAVSTIPLYALAKRALTSDALAVAMALAWLVSPTTTYLANETFHPEVMAIPFLLTGYYLASTRPSGPDADDRRVRRHNWATVAVLGAAMAWKEDVAIAVMMLGVILMVRHRRRFGAAVAGAALVYVLVVGSWLVPHLSGGNTAYSGLYGALGNSGLGVAANSVLHPSLLLHRLAHNDAWSYANRVVEPWGYVALLSPLTLLMAVPQFFINILTLDNFTWALTFHYQAIPLSVGALATVDGLALVRRRWRRAGYLVGAMALTGALATSVGWGNLPWGADYRNGSWALQDSSLRIGAQVAVDRVGPHDGVAAIYYVVPHLTHRQIIYSWPNPWRRVNYQTDDTAHRLPAKVDWIILPERSTLGAQDRALLDSLVADGEFGDPQTVDGITSWHRLEPPSGPANT